MLFRIHRGAATQSFVITQLERLEPRRFLSASSLDTTYGNNTGVVVSAFGTGAAFTSAVTLSNGHVLAAGAVNNGSHKHDFLIARYNANGSVDGAFGGGTGRVFTDFSNHDDFAAQLILLNDGKFAVVGRSTSGLDSTVAGEMAENFAIARYNANGSLDSTFNGTGKITVDFAGNFDAATAAALLSDGRLLVVGNATNSQGQCVGAVRLNLNGSLDSSFGSAGKMISHIGVLVNNGFGTFNFGNDTVNAVAVVPGGGFLVGGAIDDFYDSGINLSDFLLAKYTISGKLDTSFGGGDGWMQSNPGGQYNYANAMALLPTGKILLGGASEPFDGGNETDFALARINSNGTLDTSFGPAGSNGKVTTDLNPAPNGTSSTREEIRGLLVQPSGKVLTTGTYVFNNGTAGASDVKLLPMVRYTSNGILDTSFSGDGKQLYSALGGANAIAAAPGGKTVVVGFLGVKAAVARFGSDASANARIFGTVFNDLDGDGTRDANEGPLSNWQVFIDANGDGFLTPGETVGTSDSNGLYFLQLLPPGTYRIREVRQDGWNRTKPAGAYPLGFYDVTLAVGQEVDGKDFGNKKV